MSRTQETEKISWLADLYQRTNKNWFGLNHSSEVASTSNNVPESKKDNVADDMLIRKVAEMILDEFHLIGDSDNVKNTNTKLVNFTQPADLEKILKLEITKDGLTIKQLEDFCRQVIKYSVKTTHPHFYNQLYGGVDQFGVAGAWLTDALNTSQATYEIAPVFTLLERKIIEYCGSKCGWDLDKIDGIFSPGGSISNMYGMILARYNKFADTKENGVRGLPRLVAFGSDSSHYSLSKSSIWMGHGTNSVVKVKTDDRGKMIPSELEKEIENTIKDGAVPFVVIATAGTTVLGAFDPIREVAAICAKYNIWLHVDAALGGTFLLSLKHRTLLDGIELADSVAWNLHKLAGAPLQCSLFLTRHCQLLQHCNSLKAEYIFQSDKYYDADYDLGDKSIQCGRKVDSLKAWLTLASRGEDEWEHLVDNIIQMNRYITDKLAHRPNFKLVLPQFEGSTVSFWYIPEKLRNQTHIDPATLHKVCPAIKSRMMSSGSLMIGYQPLTCKNLPNFFRLSLTCIPPATMEDMDFIVDEIERLGKDLEF